MREMPISKISGSKVFSILGFLLLAFSGCNVSRLYGTPIGFLFACLLAAT